MEKSGASFLTTVAIGKPSFVRPRPKFSFVSELGFTAAFVALPSHTQSEVTAPKESVVAP
jgi:hypothetical protein